MGETIRGTQDADDLVGGGGDTVFGAGGNDTLRSRGNDTLYGEGGDDLFVATGEGAVTAFGGWGNDTFRDASTGAANTFDGGSGREDTYEYVGYSNGVRAVDEDDPAAGVVVSYQNYERGSPTREATLIGVERLERVAGANGRLSGETTVILAGTGGDDDRLWGDLNVATFVHGGAGDDYMEGNFEAGFRWGGDTLIGGAGDDTMVAFGGARLDGGAGNDAIDAYGSAFIDGGAGNDTITADGRDVDLTAGDGADEVILGAGSRAYIDEAEGAYLDGDTITGFGGDDRLYLRDQVQSVSLSQRRAGEDLILTLDVGDDGAADAEFVLRGTEADAEFALVNVSTAPESFSAWTILDVRARRVEGEDGGATVEGQGGDDTLIGRDGDDRLNGREGDDLIEGGAGADVIERGVGDDTVRAGAGDDTIYAGLGDDQVFGEAGDDVFRLTTPGANSHSVVDGGEGTDTIELSVIANWDTVVSSEADGLVFTTDYTRLDGVEGSVSVRSFEVLSFDYVGGQDLDVARLTLEGDLTGYFDGAAVLTEPYGATFAFDAGASVGGQAYEVTGGLGADTLTGGDGADLLIGGGGDDVLMGDGGAA